MKKNRSVILVCFCILILFIAVDPSWSATRKDLYKLLQNDPLKAKDMLLINPGEFGGDVQDTSLSTAEELKEREEWEGAAAMYQLWARVFRRGALEYQVIDIWADFLEACLRIHDANPRYLGAWNNYYARVNPFRLEKNKVRDTAVPFINKRLDDSMGKPGDDEFFGADWLTLARLVELDERDLENPSRRSRFLDILVAREQTGRQVELCNDIIKSLERDKISVDEHVKEKCAFLSEDDDPGETGESADPLLTLLDGSRSHKKARKLSAKTMSLHTSLKRRDPMWPVYTFLTAECLLKRKEKEGSLKLHKKLVKWAAGNPYKDKWGGSSLAAISLWRWLVGLEKSSRDNRGEIKEFIKAFKTLEKKRLIKGVFKKTFFTSLPRLEEYVNRGSARLAWSIGDKKTARRLFLRYLEIARNREFSPGEREIKQALVRAGKISEEEIDLHIAERLESLGHDEAAIEILNKAQFEAMGKNRIKALLLQAKIEQKTKKTRGRSVVAALLDQAEKLAGQVDAELHQEALYQRFIAWFREGEERQLELARRDMEALIRRYRGGPRTDEAIYYLAQYHYLKGNIDRSLRYYRELRSFGGANNFFNFSYFKPALILFAWDDRRNHHGIESLLKGLLAERPRGPLASSCKFWLGRLYETKNWGEREARKWFKKVIEGSPYSYFGIRARMHLNMGPSAARAFGPDEATRAQLRGAYEKSRIETKMNMTSKYYHRLGRALENGLYREVLRSETMLFSHFPDFLPRDVELKDMDEKGLTAYVGLMVALRQDALAANARDKVKNSRFQIAGAVGEKAGDWSLALSLAGDKLSSQKDPRYLATVYPGIYVDEFKKAGGDEDGEIMPALLYGVARRESRFYPVAISHVGAFGLFQFMPDVFNGLANKYGLKSSSHRYAYLSIPKRSIELGGLWFTRDMREAKPDGLFFRIIRHNAGDEALNPWVAQWEWTTQNGSLDVLKDVEYMVETIRFLSTKGFTRRVLGDMAIIHSSGVFEANEGGIPNDGEEITPKPRMDANKRE